MRLRVPLFALMIVGSTGCGEGSRGTDCETLTYDPTGLWSGTLEFDEDHSNIGPAWPPITVAHTLKFDNCSLILVDQAGVRYERDATVVDPALGFEASKKQKIVGEVVNWEVRYDDASGPTSLALYEEGSFPPHDALIRAWSGIMSRQP